MKRKKSDKQEAEEDVERLVEEALAEAEAAERGADVERLTQQILDEARIVARWQKQPFYIV